MRLLQDRYRIVQEIGRGGEGAIYLCEDLRLPGRLWAVKELRWNVTQQGDFEHEASLLSQLDHPRIPVIVDFFVQGEYGYLVCEFFDGPSLHQWVERNGAVSEAQAFQWGIQIAEVLAYLHQRVPPLYHRDLKPQNVIVTQDGLRLIDFGLAREDRGELSAQAGSVSFTAPEQFTSDHRLGPSADIYSLGSILYYLLLGLPPGPTGGAHRLRLSRPDLLPSTEQLVLQCMEEDPEKRPADVMQVLHALQYTAMRLPIPSEPILWASTQSGVEESLAKAHIPKPVSRWRLGGALLPLFALLIVAVVLVWSQVRPSGVKPSRPVAQPGNREVTWKQTKEFLNEKRWAEAEGSLQGMLATDPGSGWAHLGLAQLPLLRSHPDLPRVPLLLPLGGQEREHVDWILQGVALGQQDEKRFLFDLIDTHEGSLLQCWQDLLKSRQPPLVLGPFGSQDALLLAPLASNSGLAVVPIGSTDPRIGDFPGIFPAAFPHWGRIAALLDEVQQQRGHKGVIFYSADSKAMATSAQLAEKHIQESGQPVPQKLAYRQEDDPSATVAQLRKLDPDWIYLSDNLPVRAAKWIGHLRTGGVDAPVLCVFHPASQGFTSALSEISGQVWLVEPLWQQRNAKFVERCRRNFYELSPQQHGWSELSVDWNNALGYDVARIASSVWRPGATRQEIMNALVKSAPFPGLLGVYKLKERKIEPYEFQYRVVIVEQGRRRAGNLLPKTHP